ncbi:MAG: DUF4124 domain-containing protein [Gammaproteobacteria bacterium]
MFRILAIAGALFGLASVAQADVWRWTDPNGTIHYSDSWVPGSTLVKTDSRAAYSAPSSAAPAPTATAATPSDQAQAQRDQRVVAADVAKVQADQCKKAREAYDKAIQSRRIYKDNAGTREYLSEADADAYRLQLLNSRKQACGS